MPCHTDLSHLHLVGIMFFPSLPVRHPCKRERQSCTQNCMHTIFNYSYLNIYNHFYHPTTLYCDLNLTPMLSATYVEIPVTLAGAVNCGFITHSHPLAMLYLTSSYLLPFQKQPYKNKNSILRTQSKWVCESCKKHMTVVFKVLLRL